MQKLSNQVTRKFIDSIDLDDWEIETDTGWEDVSAIHKTVEYEEWELITESGKILIAADDHIIFDDNMNEIFLKDCIPNETYIQTKDGLELVTSLRNLNQSSHMYDITVDSPNHRFYTNGILSHNTTSLVALICWYIIFNDNRTVGILANKAATAKEILARIKRAYENLPDWLQQGVTEWNKTSIHLENESGVMVAATSSDNIRGFAVDLLFIDEAAWVDNWDEFWTSVSPTVAAKEHGRICLVSTVNGLNHFWRLTLGARQGTNNYNLVSVTWDKVPGRDEAWRKKTLSDLNGDEEKFAQEYCVSGDTYIELLDTESNETLRLTIEEAWELLDEENRSI